MTMRDLPIPDVPTEIPQGAVTHGIAVGALVSTVIGWLPAILAVLPAIYYCLLIWESKTVQGLLQRRREKKAARAVAKAQAQVVVAKTEVAIAQDTAQAVSTDPTKK